ncbi:MAG TPA: carboxypeptidase-like regulatory domain-containing protein, partial [Acidobacteriota bacterium]
MFAAPAQAQFARASVAGTVADPDGAPLPGVTVTVRNEDSGLIRTAVTSGSGGYVMQGLVPGTYTVTFALEGFRPVERPGVLLR